MKSLKKIFDHLLIIIPAKGNSSRLKDKNIYSVKKKKLIEYTFDQIKKIGLKKSTYVSTDSDEIINLTKKNKFNFIKRPKSISKKNSSTESAIIHAIKLLDPKLENYKWVLTLPPTSPLRSTKTILNSFKKAKMNQFSSIISLTLNRGDFWLSSSNGNYTRLFKKASRRQQERNFLFEETSSLYLNKIKELIKSNSLINGKVGAVLTNKEESLDINDINDINLFKALIK